MTSGVRKGSVTVDMLRMACYCEKSCFFHREQYIGKKGKMLDK